MRGFQKIAELGTLSQLCLIQVSCQHEILGSSGNYKNPCPDFDQYLQTESSKHTQIWHGCCVSEIIIM